METVFPFGLPFATGFYLFFYVLTLVIHVAFMNYVLAGCGWIAIVRPRAGNDTRSESTRILKDWLPLMLSGAITAGIAPLLFVQILYKREYYTANLLLFNRWMAILPILIVGFYSLYLLKSYWLKSRANWIIAVISSVPFVCVAFTGYSWTENHLLSVRDTNYWSEFYATRSQVYSESQLIPRLLVWAFGSIPTMCLILAWQHWYRGNGRPALLAKVALVGLLLVSGAAIGYHEVTSDTVNAAFVSTLAIPYFVIAILGLVLQVAGWVWLLRQKQFSFTGLVVTSVGLAFTLVGMTVCREAVRIHTLGKERFESLYPVHEEAFGRGGFLVFLAFFVINAGLIGLCFWLVRTKTLPVADAQHGASIKSL
ncbi:hypothetical protein [Zavarzinella formosa]|uniref:hypothetical protein n=1 Tax=Zavarzinella formosa TaxID=360055 RepID=UPI00031AD632|nr:hypothetical protein [Zavarzinella formosa]